jgi:hypothetical protein
MHMRNGVSELDRDSLQRRLAALKRDRAEALADARRANEALAEANRRIEDILDEMAVVRAALQRHQAAGAEQPAWGTELARAA